MAGWPARSRSRTDHARRRGGISGVRHCRVLLQGRNPGDAFQRTVPVGLGDRVLVAGMTPSTCSAHGQFGRVQDPEVEHRSTSRRRSDDRAADPARIPARCWPGDRLPAGDGPAPPVAWRRSSRARSPPAATRGRLQLFGVDGALAHRDDGSRRRGNRACLAALRVEIRSWACGPSRRPDQSARSAPGAAWHCFTRLVQQVVVDDINNKLF